MSKSDAPQEDRERRLRIARSNIIRLTAKLDTLKRVLDVAPHQELLQTILEKRERLAYWREQELQLSRQTESSTINPEGRPTMGSYGSRPTWRATVGAPKRHQEELKLGRAMASTRGQVAKQSPAAAFGNLQVRGAVSRFSRSIDGPINPNVSVVGCSQKER